jgi:hypothetical protein
MLYKIEDGDEIKVFPFIENNKLVWGKQYDMIFTKTGIVYDTNGYLMKMAHHTRVNSTKVYGNINVTKKTLIHAYINGESKLIAIGKRLIDIMSDNRSTLFDLRCNDHLHIVKEMVSIHNGLSLPNYEKSYVISKDWNVPVTNIDSQEEWMEYLKTNQPDTSLYTNNHSIAKNREGLNELFGGDLLSEIIKNERNDKLTEILK